MITSKKRENIVKKAVEFVGVKKGSAKHKNILGIYNRAVKNEDICNRYNPEPRSHQMSVEEAWCATFVSAVGLLCDVEDYPCECSCNKQIAQLKNMGYWIEDDAYIPSPADIIYYDWQDSGKGDNTGTADHVGIVEKIVSGNIHVIEGNMSGMVGRRIIPVNGKYIRGFGKISVVDEPEPTPTVEDTTYQARVTPSNGLNVRKGPGTGYAKITALKYGTIITILEEKSGWGKIIYGGKEGWVSLRYTKKV